MKSPKPLCRIAICDRQSKSKGLCSAHYLRLKRTGDTQADVPLKPYRPSKLTAAEVLRYYTPEALPDECWEWTGAIARVGYGVATYGGVTVLAHRLAYQVEHAVTLTEDQVVRHSCDNRPCVNPSHLIVGTYLENIQDAVDRDRVTHGVRNPGAKLTEDDVRQIRKLALQGMNYREIAERFPITRTNVGLIIRGLAWWRVA